MSIRELFWFLMLFIKKWAETGLFLLSPNLHSSGLSFCGCTLYSPVSNELIIRYHHYPVPLFVTAYDVIRNRLVKKWRTVIHQSTYWMAHCLSITPSMCCGGRSPGLAGIESELSVMPLDRSSDDPCRDQPGNWFVEHVFRGDYLLWCLIIWAIKNKGMLKCAFYDLPEMIFFIRNVIQEQTFSIAGYLIADQNK